jgi:hypothetical protein
VAADADHLAVLEREARRRDVSLTQVLREAVEREADRLRRKAEPRFGIVRGDGTATQTIVALLDASDPERPRPGGPSSRTSSAVPTACTTSTSEISLGLRNSSTHTSRSIWGSSMLPSSLRASDWERPRWRPWTIAPSRSCVRATASISRCSLGKADAEMMCPTGLDDKEDPRWD